MATLSPGARQRDGFRRLFIGVPFSIGAALLGIVVVPLAIAVGFVDILWQTLTNREGLDSMNLVSRWYKWFAHNTLWTFSGRGDFQAMP